MASLEKSKRIRKENIYIESCFSNVIDLWSVPFLKHFFPTSIFWNTSGRMFVLVS